jgi:hypothetical protein
MGVVSVLWSFGDAVLVWGDRHECGRGAVHGRRIRSRGLIEGSACASLVALVILSEGTFFFKTAGYTTLLIPFIFCWKSCLALRAP